MHSVRVFATLLIVGTCAAAAADPHVVADAAYLHAQQRVEVEHGRRLNLYCLGRGTPTVVFESGLTDETSTWGLVQPAVARNTRACSCDRAGVGFSDAGLRPASSQNIVDDLHRLLAAAKIKPPYILVSHSLGGVHAKLFAYLHRDEIAGLVFVDPSHEDQREGYRLLDPRGLSPQQLQQLLEPGLNTRRTCAALAIYGFEPGTDAYKKCSFAHDAHYDDAINAVHVRIDMLPAFQNAQLSEEENMFTTNTAQLHAARRSLGDLPLIVLTESPQPRGKTETQEQRDAKNRLWLSLNQDIATLSTRGVDRVVAGAGHAIQFDQPQAVVDAILEVLAAARR